MTVRSERRIVLESYIEAVLSFLYTADQLRLWNSKIQRKIEEAQRKGDPQLDDLVEIKEKVNREFYERKGK